MKSVLDGIAWVIIGIIVAIVVVSASGVVVEIALCAIPTAWEKLCSINYSDIRSFLLFEACMMLILGVSAGSIMWAFIRMYPRFPEWVRRALISPDSEPIEEDID